MTARGQFASELDAAKFAMAYAVKVGATAGVTENTGTKWNVGSVDPDGSLRVLLEALYPENGEPYRLTEHLMNEGIRLIAQAGASFDLYDILFGQPTGAT